MDWGERAPQARGTGPFLLGQVVYDRILREPIHKGVIQSSDNLPHVGEVPRVKAPFPNLSTAAGCRAGTAAGVGATLWRGGTSKETSWEWSERRWQSPDTWKGYLLLCKSE